MLLVEDSEDDAFFFKRAFKKTGMTYGLQHVSNGVAAIEFLNGASTSDSLPGIIFLDLKMPILNGFDVLLWMQKQAFASRITIIALSGSDQQKDKERARELGAADYLVKPVTAADFQRVLEKAPAGRHETPNKGGVAH